MKVPASDLQDLCQRVLVSAGATEANSFEVAEHLVLASLSGVDSHGIYQLPGYVEAIRGGEIDPKASPEVIKDGAGHALISGNWTFGQVAARYAMDTASNKAEVVGLSAVGLVRAHHIGRVGHYVERAAQRGLGSLIFTGGYGVEAPAAAPYGGRSRLLHTNPIAFAFPGREEPPVSFDFATTALAGTKVLMARQRNEPLPAGSIVDRDGRATVRADDFFAGGAFLPFGGHKGYALMLAAEILGRVFTGSDDYAEAHRGGQVMRHQGVTMIVFKADLLSDGAAVGGRVDDLEQRVRGVPPAPGFDRVLVPGDPERSARAKRAKEGLEIDDATWRSLQALV